MASLVIDKTGLPRVVDIFDYLPPQEGEINIYYGRIGSGKTYAGTRNILNELRRGNVVYANWNVKFDGYDERDNFWLLLLGVLGIKKHFKVIPKSNFHFWDFQRQLLDGREALPFVDQLSVLTDCSVHLDEGHIPFDSYEATKMSERKRSAVFATRHFNRKLTIYTQRANSVHTNLRGNSNRFFKCESFKHRFLFWSWLTLQVTEFQDLSSSGSVDETRVFDKDGLETDEYKFAVSQERFRARKKIFDCYDTKYLRGEIVRYVPNYADIIELGYFSIWTRLLGRFNRGRTKLKINN